MAKATVATANELLIKAEERDSYRGECLQDLANRRAREHTQYQPAPTQAQANPQPATDFLSSLPRWIHGPAQRSQIIWMHPSADAGLPHTRPGNLICMPLYWPNERLADTLVHELVHCWQRQAPQAWKALYQAQGWRLARDSEIERIPADYLNRIRINPDTLLSGPFWVWRDSYIPLALFQRLDRPSLKETDIRWFHLESGASMRQPPSDFRDYYGPVSDPEHPAEVAAYSLAEPATFRNYPAWGTFQSLTGIS